VDSFSAEQRIRSAVNRTQVLRAQAREKTLRVRGSRYRAPRPEYEPYKSKGVFAERVEVGTDRAVADRFRLAFAKSREALYGRLMKQFGDSDCGCPSESGDNDE